ncbi:glycosyltransferase family 2 protein [Stygiolobus caldivivus]|uniref:Glycosyl transferase n=1 Tax=Stygiolobus caldivivus TaxID=2824673 RepID=A0A8D5ZI84_9CREN|nr:glycosyltransferase [Stygiolobus caldivivus]BCU69062.1 glycosyl transferase [Stygiolobus caldivivus]
MVSLSIIVVNVKGKDKFPKLYESLLKSRFKDFEVIVIDIIDNGFNDIRFRNVKIEKDRGLAYCRNIGVKYSMGKFLLFLDNDTEIMPDTLEKFMSYISERPNEIVQLKLVREDGTLDATGGLIDNLAYPHELNRGLSENSVNEIIEVLYAKGAAIGMSRDVFNLVGGYDEEYFYGYDETDLCFRAWKRGIRVVFYPFAKVIHHEHGSFSLDEKKRLYRLTYFLESRRIYFFLKNFSSAYVIKNYPKLAIVFVGSIFLDILKRKDPIAAKAKIKASIWVLSRIPLLIKKRLSERPSKVIYDESYLISKGLIKKH